MKRYVLTYQGYGEAPDALETRISEEAGDGEMRVVERFGDHLVIEGQREELAKFVSGLRGWFSSPERRLSRPRTFGSP
jgi:hypothetical protein